jgi:hypothetical protein
MTSDYMAIQTDNHRRYGTDIGRIGPMLLANRYGDRTHFIFELLQNAEDALDRRDGWDGPRAVAFKLSGSLLRVSHFGAPFTEADVRGICGIAEGNKDLTSIGRFGIGFKSVYAFTECPEIHSGDEHFAIDSFVWPREVPVLDLKDGETVFIIPLRQDDLSATKEITDGLRKIGPRTLLFLRQIEEISWTVESGPSGLYLRSKPEPVGENARKVLLIGEQDGAPDVEERWLIFSCDVWTDDGEKIVKVGYLEVAFKLDEDDESGPLSVEPLHESLLVVFFPTTVQTNLGFLVQGPYRTTPSRDNVPPSDPWNQHLVQETGTLLVEALHWLRDHDLLDTAALRCLPLDAVRFGEGSRFAPLFKATRDALTSGPFLPRFGGGHVSARNARLARTQELRELFSPRQLGTLFDAGGELAWLCSDITQDRTPELRQYLIHELDIPEVTPEMILSKLDKRLLKAQTDEWICMLYEFLNGQPALRRRLDDLPLVRLEDSTHVVARANGHPQAFLPGEVETDFPTVKRTVCATEEAWKFLESLGLTEPDPVDDVIWNVLPKYREDEVDVDDASYAADISRILHAFGSDSKAQREKLIDALRDTGFVRAVAATDGSKRVSKPGEVYLATERLKELFARVGGVLLVDDANTCLRGESIRDLLEACGATRYLQQVPVECDLSWEQRSAIRRNAGLERSTWQRPISDVTLRGLDALLNLLPQLEPVERRHKTTLLWEALADVESRRGSGAFVGEYTWGYSHETRTAPFDAAFVRHLNAIAWVPDANGELQLPEFVFFDSLGWKPSPFLLSKIRFKPPIIETLAKEAGIELGVLDLLKKLGVTSEAELRARLGIEDEPETHNTAEPNDVNEALKKLLGDSVQPTPPVPDPTGPEPIESGSGRGGAGIRGETASGGRGGTSEDMKNGDRTGARIPHAGTDTGKNSPGRSSGRPFISFVGTHPDDAEPDPDRLGQQARMALEEKAITLILADQPHLKRTPTHNPGYDLFEAGEDGQPVRWVEVKAMTGGLTDRPVGLSRTQFECAREHGEAYWLYVVEYAGDENHAHIVRIQDPAGKARTFTFDHGWLAVAELVEGGTALAEEVASS